MIDPSTPQSWITFHTSMWDTLYLVTVKSMVEIWQNFVAFSEYMNFKGGFSLEVILIFIKKFIHPDGWIIPTTKMTNTSSFLRNKSSKIQ